MKKNEARVLVLCSALSLCWAAAGCVTASQGQAMQMQIDQLQEQLKTAKSYHGILMQAQEDIGKLQKIIESAAQNLGENAADFALQIDQIRNDLASLEGKFAELTFEFDKMWKTLEESQAAQAQEMKKYEQMIDIDAPIDPSLVPADKDALWKKAQASLDDKDFKTARGLFKEYQKKYPDDARADDAQLSIGLAYLGEKRGAKALGELQKVIDDYPLSDKMDAVLYHMGEAFFMIQNCSDARTLFKAVISQFPSSPYKKKAKDKIQEILKAPKSVCPSIN
jgi:TolA-binding protein